MSYTVGFLPDQYDVAAFRLELQRVSEAILALTVPEVWHEVGSGGNEPAFANSWANSASSGGIPLQFYKDQMGLVHIRGRVDAGTTGTTVFTLPVGYRPLVDTSGDELRFLCINDSDNEERCIIDDAGAFQLTRAATWVDVGEIIFRAVL